MSTKPDSEMSHTEVLLDIISKVTGMSPAAIRADIERRKRSSERRAQTKQARYLDALLQVTPEQARKVEALKQQGATQHRSLRQHRTTLQVCLFMQAEKWCSAKGRVATKLYAIYPDGSHAETFERTIRVDEKRLAAVRVDKLADGEMFTNASGATRFSF